MSELFNRQVIGDGATWMCSSQLGAPQMNGAAGSNGQLLQVLDAVLVTGFNEQAVSSVELLADGFVKVKFGTSVDYRARQKVLISGATDTNLNGEHIITQIIGNDFIIKAPDVSVLTGTIKTKVAPLGWQSIFGTTNPLKRAYRSTNPSSTQTVLYLDMTLPAGNGYNPTAPVKRAMVSMCEDMIELGVQIGSHTDALNDYAQYPNGSLFWHQARGKGETEAVTATSNGRWTIVGNSDYFYFMPEWTSSTTYRNKGYRDFFCFGDFPSLAGASDDWCCGWAGCFGANDTSNSDVAYNGASVSVYDSKFFISSSSGIGSMIPFKFAALSDAGYSSGYTNGINYPNATTQSLVCNSLYSLSANSLRSFMPRIMSIQHNLGTTNITSYTDTIIDNFLIVPVAAISFNKTVQSVGYFAFDMGD